ncbi:hypothetical protein B0O99DRAFT_638341 [Bisporella sp. PMI_857]|nr:hypothetical protein B0O99DRAFT_638341 [Bisporella sp. PMI_857]
MSSIQDKKMKQQLKDTGEALLSVVTSKGTKVTSVAIFASSWKMRTRAGTKKQAALDACKLINLPIEFIKNLCDDLGKVSNACLGLTCTTLYRICFKEKISLLATECIEMAGVPYKVKFELHLLLRDWMWKSGQLIWAGHFYEVFGQDYGKLLFVTKKKMQEIEELMESNFEEVNELWEEIGDPDDFSDSEVLEDAEDLRNQVYCEVCAVADEESDYEETLEYLGMELVDYGGFIGKRQWMEAQNWKPLGQADHGCCC